MHEPKIYALIIGTEILNRRRSDKHFDFVTTLLESYGRKLSGSLIIEDDPELIVDTIRLIASRPDSILFSFGGIGSTPDDHTRLCAARALRDGELYTHEEIRDIIVSLRGEKAYPHSVKMAELPQGAEKIDNPFNGMPAFNLDNRFFFVPGFPEMSHPMLTKIANELFISRRELYRHTFTAKCAESRFIEIMETMPDGVEFSSLPKHYEDGWRVSISVASYDEELAQSSFERYIEFLIEENIEYTLTDEAN